MIKILFTIFLIIITKLSIADGMDKIQIYLNRKLISEITEFNADSNIIEYSDKDTLNLILYTDWGGEFGAKLSVIYENKIIIPELKKIKPKAENGHFYLVLDKDFSSKQYSFLLTYLSNKHESWKFMTTFFKLIN